MKNIRKIIILVTAFIFILSSAVSCTNSGFFQFAMDTGDTENINNYPEENRNTKNNVKSPEIYSNSAQPTDTVKLIVPSDFTSMTLPDVITLPEKIYTIMIYMNGSDLETDYESATDDIFQMFESGFDSDNINLILFTGGTHKWHIREIPNNINAIFQLDPKSGGLIKLAEVGKDAMGKPEVLAGFINLCYELFPAQNYGIIFWNHGGGAVVGYGSDERYEHSPEKSMMRLSEIDSAFASTNLIQDNTVFEFVGFDTCLMATLEMACIAGKYAKYMIASEELEPSSGWDYYFLGEIVPGMSGHDIGKLIIDYYAEYYLYFEDKEIITLSLTELSEIQAVAAAFENLAAAAGGALAEGHYNLISKARSKSRMFGSYEEHGGGSDMIDTAHLAESLINLLPAESGALLDALEQAVVYKHDNSIETLGGLSIYFPFTNKQDIDYYISIYKTMNQLPNYTSFIEEFSNILRGGSRADYRSIDKTTPVRSQSGDCTIALTPEQLENLAEVYLIVWENAPHETDNQNGKKYIQIGKSSKADIKDDGVITINFDRTWTMLNDRRVCLYEIARNGERVRYAIPARLNGKDVDLIAVYTESYPDGKIVGAVPINDEAGAYNVLNKKAIKIEDGDKIEILYHVSDDLFGSDSGGLWYSSDEFIVEGELKLKENIIPKSEYFYGIILVDTKKNDYHTGFGIISK